MASRGRALLAGLFFVSGCPEPEDEKAATDSTHDSATVPDTEESAELTESGSTTESVGESDSETGTTPDWTDPGHDWDGDGFTEDAGDCNDRDDWTFPGAIETCPDREDQDCDGLVDEECHIFTDWFGGSVKFDSIGIVEVARTWEARNDAGEVICSGGGEAFEGSPAPECPECLWTFGQHGYIGEPVVGPYRHGELLGALLVLFGGHLIA